MTFGPPARAPAPAREAGRAHASAPHEMTDAAGRGYLFPPPPAVVGGGDQLVLFNDTPAARALIEYLATPEAAEIWVKRGGFSSPNSGVPPESYPDPILRETATALAEAETFRFDLSDLQPSAFGGTVGQGLFKLFQDFLDNPDDVDGIAQQMEDAAAKAYKE